MSDVKNATDLLIPYTIDELYELGQQGVLASTRKLPGMRPGGRFPEPNTPVKVGSTPMDRGIEHLEEAMRIFRRLDITKVGIENAVNRAYSLIQSERRSGGVR